MALKITRRRFAGLVLAGLTACGLFTSQSILAQISEELPPTAELQKLLASADSGALCRALRLLALHRVKLDASLTPLVRDVGVKHPNLWPLAGRVLARADRAAIGLSATDPKPELRAAWAGMAPWMLVDDTRPQAAAAFVTLFTDPVPAVRSAATQAFPEMADAINGNDLATLAKDKNPVIRAAGLRGQARFMSISQLKPDSDPALAVAVAEATLSAEASGRNGRQDVDAAAFAIILKSTQSTAESKVKCLHRMSGAQGFPGLIDAAAEAARDKDPVVREHTVRALHKMSGYTTVDQAKLKAIFAELLKDSDPTVRLEALTQHPSPRLDEQAARYAAFSKDPEPRIQDVTRYGASRLYADRKKFLTSVASRDEAGRATGYEAAIRVARASESLDHPWKILSAAATDKSPAVRRLYVQLLLPIVPQLEFMTDAEKPVVKLLVDPDLQTRLTALRLIEAMARHKPNLAANYSALIERTSPQFQEPEYQAEIERVLVGNFILAQRRE